METSSCGPASGATDISQLGRSPSADRSTNAAHGEQPPRAPRRSRTIASRTKIRWYRGPARSTYRYFNAYNEGTVIHMDGCVAVDYSAEDGKAFEERVFKPPPPHGSWVPEHPVQAP